MAARMNAIDRLCRACMCANQNFHSMAEYGEESTLKISEMLATAVPQIVIQNGDGMPEVLCAACLNKMNIAFKFQQMCVTTDKRLRSAITNQHTAELTKNHEIPKISIHIEDHKLLQTSSVKTTSSTPLQPLPVVIVQEKCQPLLKKPVVSEYPEYPETNLVPNVATVANAIDRNGQLKETPNANVQIPLVDHIKRSIDCNNEIVDSEIIKQSKIDCERVENNLDQIETELHPLPPHHSFIHNDTGLGDIEKPNSRNIRKGEHQCSDCGKVFNRPYLLKRHSTVHSPDLPFECKICKYRFLNKTHMLRHRLKHKKSDKNPKDSHPPEGYKCSECPRRFEKCQSLAAHCQTHRRARADLNGKQIKCDFCELIFDNIKSLQEHVLIHPESQKYKCKLCSKNFAYEPLLREDEAKHNGVTQFACIYCGKAFQQNSTLKEHLRIHTGEKPYLCNKCGKSFPNSSNLRQHLLRHSDEKKYKCQVCSNKFACQSDLSKHMSTHRTEKRHVCNICGGSFKRKYSFTKHKNIHTGHRPHVCGDCGMSFVFVEHYRRHLRTHTGERPYKCEHCDRAYADSGDLKRHLRTHVGEKIYCCDKCPEAFKYRFELREHKTIHIHEEKSTKCTDAPKGNSPPGNDASEV